MLIVRPARFELAILQGTGPQSRRVYQFRHGRMMVSPGGMFG